MTPDYTNIDPKYLKQELQEDRAPDFTGPHRLTIIGLGGCGTELVHKICEHDWFLKSYIHDCRHLNLYTIDNDSDQNARSRRFFASHIDDGQELETITPLLDRWRAFNPQADIRGKHLHLPDIAALNSLEDLATEKCAAWIKEKSTSETGLSPIDVWWMHDPDATISFDDLQREYPELHRTFSGGMHRIRGAAKAVFYKAVCTEPHIFREIANTNTVTIIVGLGGGTGSGILLDLIHYLQKNRVHNICVFAILPSKEEPEMEKLNAAIALTELEYLSAQKEHQFNGHRKIQWSVWNEFLGCDSHVSIVTSSLDATGYSGENSKNMQYLEDFDTAFPYTFFHYLREIDIHPWADYIQPTGVRPYAKFILVNSAVVEYKHKVGDTAKQTLCETCIDGYTKESPFRRVVDGGIQVNTQHFLENILSQIHNLVQNLRSHETLGLQGTSVIGNNGEKWSPPCSLWNIGTRLSVLDDILNGYPQNMRNTICSETTRTVHRYGDKPYVGMHTSHVARSGEISLSFFVVAGFIDLLNLFGYGISDVRKMYGRHGKHKFMYHTLGLEKGLLYLRRGDNDVIGNKEAISFRLADAVTAACAESKSRNDYQNTGIETIQNLYVTETIQESLEILSRRR